MGEVGLGLEGHYAKGVDDFRNKTYSSILITACDEAEERCPTFPGLGERHYWPIADPVTIEGSEEEKLKAFRRARDEIERRVLEWVASRRDKEGHSG